MPYPVVIIKSPPAKKYALGFDKTKKFTHIVTVNTKQSPTDKNN